MTKPGSSIPVEICFFRILKICRFNSTKAVFLIFGFFLSFGMIRVFFQWCRFFRVFRAFVAIFNDKNVFFFRLILIIVIHFRIANGAKLSYASVYILHALPVHF